MKKSKKLGATSGILNQSGQGLTEYITLLLLVSILSVAAAKTLGKTIRGKIEMAEGQISKHISLRNNGGNEKEEGNGFPWPKLD